MTALLIALLVFVLVGTAATATLRARRASAPQRAPGLEQLAALRWREFSGLVRQAMQARGYRVLKDDNSPGDELPSDGGDILLERDGQRVLLLCKYGNASVVGAPPILGLGKAAELRGAHAAIVVTPGRFDSEARRVATRQQIELIDGASLWPEVKPFLDDAGVTPTTAPTRHLGMPQVAWLGAAVAGGMTWFLLHWMPGGPGMPGAAPAAPKATVPVLAPRPAPVQKAAAEPVEPVPIDPALLAERRSGTANAISTLEGVDRAAWITQSTLVVYLATEDADPSRRLCPLLERYPELASSRVQLQAPPGSQRPVRFRQCRAY